jgi:hypothetical protein
MVWHGYIADASTMVLRQMAYHYLYTFTRDAVGRTWQGAW